MIKQFRRHVVLSILFVIFAAPSLCAYLFYKHPHWLGSSTVNKGTLLMPTVQMDSLPQSTKWKLILRSDANCDKACFNLLDQLARIRLALGRTLYLVDEFLLLDQRSVVSKPVEQFMKEGGIRLVRSAPSENSSLGSFKQYTVFIANPDNYLILGYRFNADPQDIYKDLKFLLKQSAS